MSRKRKQRKYDLVSKKLSFNENLRENSRSPVEKINDQEEAVNLRDILKTKWKVFRVSPIYNFDNKKLKLYENKLTEELNSKKRVTSNISFKCKFVLNECLRLNDQCQEALQVEITSQTNRVYVGYFISWDNARQNIQGSISLPILLVDAKAHETPAVHSSLCKIFDCDIQPVTFSFCALITFFVKMLETPRKNDDDDDDKEYLTLEYKVPGCEIRDNVKVTLFMDDTTVVLAGTMENLRQRNEDITNMEIIWEFYSRILNHIYNVFQMDLVLADLYKIVFPDGHITTNGEVKISTNDAAISALSVLNCFTPLNAVTNM